MSLQALLNIPDNVRHAADLLAALDRCFLSGFGRLGPEQHAALQSLQRVCAGTPLEAPVQAAVTALARNEFVDRHFVAVAAGRAAVQAALYDALRAQAGAALGRPEAVKEAVPAAAAEPSGPLQNWQESARNWLMEVALAGFPQLESQTLAPFFSTLEQLQGEPRALRLAALLTGLLHELLESLPVSALPAIPTARWADLWTRAMLASAALPSPPAGRKVSGTLTFLGADLHAHGYFVSCDFYCLLEPKGEPARTARLTMSAYKVPVVNGSDLWCCLPAVADDAVRGLSQHLTFSVEGLTLLPGGDLLWDGKAKAGREAAFVDLAKKRLSPGAADAPAPLVCAAGDRHPVQLAELVYLGPYKVKASEGETYSLDLGDSVELPVAMRRLSEASEIKPAKVAASSGMLGLLRFDGGRWEVQPLAVVIEGKKPEVVFTGSEAAGARKAQSKTLATLRERASKLLRQKA